MVCLYYVENVSAAQVRYSVRRLRRKAANAKIIVALLWDGAEANDQEPFGDVRLARPTTAAAVGMILAASEQAVPTRLLSLDVANG